MSDKKLNIYKAIWLFLIGCLLGYALETVFYYLKYGNYVNKQGLIIGPFKPIYGTGTVLISFVFSQFKTEKKWQIFVIGTILGTIFEYLCSYFLEVIWGFYIWDYSTFNFNINGRIYLPYCLIWGLISVGWYSYAYPLFLKIYNKFNSKKFRIITGIIGIFFIIDLALTGLVYFRIKDSENNNKIYQIVDKLFPKEEVASKFSKVRKIKK